MRPLARRQVDASLAWQLLESVLATARADGFLSIQMTPLTAAHDPHLTQPPLLAWGVWEVYQQAKSEGVGPDQLAAAYLKLKRCGTLPGHLQSRPAVAIEACGCKILAVMFDRCGINRMIVSIP